ncbi:MAG: hypothetical protein L3J16_06085, partial [Anaerolineales bacterium]|nr:hypothetical protein [Anaerolineales bacterium]
MTDIKQYMSDVGRNAREASRLVARADSGVKNAALEAIAAGIENNKAALLKANAKDMEAGRASGLDAALLDRLELNDARIAGMAEGLR